jgi:hypothetical protein
MEKSLSEKKKERFHLKRRDGLFYSFPSSAATHKTLNATRLVQRFKLSQEFEAKKEEE